jgi:hypothetical protein
MSSWTPREVDLAGFILSGSREEAKLNDIGDHDLADEIHRELWLARNELRSIRNILGK